MRLATAVVSRAVDGGGEGAGAVSAGAGVCTGAEVGAAHAPNNIDTAMNALSRLTIDCMRSILG